MRTLTYLWIRTTLAMRNSDDRDRGGASADHVIWVAFLAGIALTVTALFGPKILAAAQGIQFK